MVLGCSSVAGLRFWRSGSNFSIWRPCGEHPRITLQQGAPLECLWLAIVGAGASVMYLGLSSPFRWRKALAISCKRRSSSVIMVELTSCLSRVILTCASLILWASFHMATAFRFLLATWSCICLGWALELWLDSDWGPMLVLAVVLRAVATVPQYYPLP